MANEKQLDLIARKALLKTLDRYINPMPNESGYEFLRGIATAITEIEDSPAVDAVEVVHGRWEDGICTMCGYPIPTDSKCDFIDEDDCLFCYHCGAKMDGGNEDGVDD